MTFEPIESQEQLDAIIKERVERAKKTAVKETEEKYGDYESLKKKAEEIQNLAGQKDERIKELEKEREAQAKEMATLKGEIGSLEMEKKKVAIAHEAGLPLEMAGRLSGEDEEALKADAEALKSLMGSKRSVPPLGSTEGAPKDESDTRNALRGMLNGMREQD